MASLGEAADRTAEAPKQPARDNSGPGLAEGGEGEATTEELAAREEVAKEPARDGAEEADPSALASRRSGRHAIGKVRKVKKTSAGPTGEPRPAPRYTSMEDARQAEVLLEKLRRHEFDFQLSQQPLAGVLDGLYVSMLQASNGVLRLRDSIRRFSDSQSRALDRAERLDKRCKELAEEARGKLEAAERERAAVEADRDAWRERSRDAEDRLEGEIARSEAVAVKVAALTRDLGSASQRAEELAGTLQRTEEQLGLAEARALVAEERADTACSQAQAAETRAGEAEGAIAKAEEDARKAVTAQLLAAARLWDAEARLEEAESRAWRAEAEAKSTAEKMQKVVSDLVNSPAILRELAEAAADAYLQGFNDCRAKMATVYSLEGTEDVRPGDLDVPETPNVGVDTKEEAVGDKEEKAVGNEEEGAGNAPPQQ